MIKPGHKNTSIRCLHPLKASCKGMQHCRPTALNIVECYMLRPLAHSVACCCNVVAMLLGVVAQSLKLVKLLAVCKWTQQLSTLLGQQCWELLCPFAHSLNTSNFIHITLPQ